MQYVMLIEQKLYFAVAKKVEAVTGSGTASTYYDGSYKSRQQ